MFEAIARRCFDAYARRGATVRAVWYPSSGAPVCEGDVVRDRVEAENGFGGEQVTKDVIEYMVGDFPGLRENETVSLDGVDWTIYGRPTDDGIIAKAHIGLPDQTRPRA